VWYRCASSSSNVQGKKYVLATTLTCSYIVGVATTSVTLSLIRNRTVCCRSDRMASTRPQLWALSQPRFKRPLSSHFAERCRPVGCSGPLRSIHLTQYHVPARFRHMLQQRAEETCASSVQLSPKSFARLLMHMLRNIRSLHSSRDRPTFRSAVSPTQ